MDVGQQSPTNPKLAQPLFAAHDDDTEASLTNDGDAAVDVLSSPVDVVVSVSVAWLLSLISQHLKEIPLDDGQQSPVNPKSAQASFSEQDSEGEEVLESEVGFSSFVSVVVVAPPVDDNGFSKPSIVLAK